MVDRRKRSISAAGCERGGGRCVAKTGTLESLMTNKDTQGDLQSQTIAQLAELAGGLAHELRNPLSTMKVNLKLLAEDLSDESARFEDIRRRALIKVDVLKREADRLQSVFDDFLNLTGGQGLQRTPTDLNAVVDRLIEFFEPMATSHGIVLQRIVGVDPLVCPVDEKLLSQALLNLVVNAKDAMPQAQRRWPSHRRPPAHTLHPGPGHGRLP